ncbi:phage portal protein [Streptomyces phytophilus]|uniref:phage portal protein n=1 Tax=Streptomyces phytophilus TaxID=722715 RepID=UPI0015F062D2|nr:phage portal protein [Streptomyces phytophilus]
MGFLRSAMRATVGPLSGIATPEKWVVDWWTGGGANSAGVHVDQDTALTYSAFFAGVRVISEDLGGLPLHLYEWLQPRGKRRAKEHPLYRVLNLQPNDMMTSLQLRETLQGHALTWGDGVANVVWDNAGQVAELWPLRPDRLRIRSRRLGPGRLRRYYVYDDSVNGIHTTLLPNEVLHVAGLGFDGVRGYSVVDMAANSIGLGLATEHHGAKFFGNGANPGGVLSHPGNISKGARERIRADWETTHRGLDRAQRVAILEEGVAWQSIGIPNDNAQFLETRKLQVTEMARWLRIPPHKIGDLERATFSNIEHQQLDYVTTALRSWLVRWEQAIALQLLLPEEREQFFAEHLVDALLRGDTMTRYQAYAIGRQWGWLSANDVREKENENPVDGGDDYMVPLNMVPAGSAAAAASADGGRGNVRLALNVTGADEALEQAIRKAVELDGGAAGRYARALRGRGMTLRASLAEQYGPKIEAIDAEIAELEADAVEDLVTTHLEPARGRRRRTRTISSFVSALRTLYAPDGPIAAAMGERWLPLFTAFAGDVAEDAAADVGHDDDVDLTAWVRAYVAAHVGYHVSSSFGQLRALTEKTDTVDDLIAAVAERLAKWQAERPERTARWEKTQLPNAAARETWREAGVAELKWVARGSKNCPHCTKLDGRTVGIETPFIAKGDAVDDDAEDGEKLVAKRNTFHPPVHAGCNCQVVPVV